VLKETYDFPVARCLFEREKEWGRGEEWKEIGRD
jgi:hypothetical protein